MPKRLADDVARRVRALIEEQKLEAGMRLPAERQLAAQLGVSRNSLREALAMLVNEGVLLSVAAAAPLFAGSTKRGRSKTSFNR